MKYENEICPGCGKPLQDGEDIVVCPDCATPQHRECYNKLGSCVNGYLHASDYVWQSEKTELPTEEEVQPNVDERGFFCPICGTKNAPGAFKCENCGNPMPMRVNANAGIPLGTIQADQSINGLGIDENEIIGEEKAIDIALYVKRNQAKFIPKFRKFADGTQKISWNWPAFLLSPFYFFYRRMAKIGFAFFGVFVAISLCITPVLEKHLEPYMAIVEQTVQSGETQIVPGSEEYETIESEMYKAINGIAHDPVFIACSAAFILTHIISGLVADRLYYKKCLKDIALVREAYPEEIVLRGMLFRVGGASFMSFICSVFCFDIVCNLLMMLADYIIS